MPQQSHLLETSLMVMMRQVAVAMGDWESGIGGEVRALISGNSGFVVSRTEI